MVGATAAYAIAIAGLVDDIVLIDVNEKLAWGQSADINDALGLDSAVQVKVGDYSDMSDNDIAIIASGVSQKPGQTRHDLVDTNASIAKEVTDKIIATGKQPFIIVVTNPVDVLTYLVLKQSGLPRSRVFGTGTTLDTSRLRSAIADMSDVDSGEVEAYVMGEHGDSSFSTIESASIGEIPLSQYPNFNLEDIKDIDSRIQKRAYDIVESKGSTHFAIGQVLAKIVDALTHDSKSVLPVCSLMDGEYGLSDVVLSMPSLVSNQGVSVLDGYPLSDPESVKLKNSADVISGLIGRYR